MKITRIEDPILYQVVKPLSLRRNFSWTFVGNVIYAGSHWGMLTILAKLGSPEMVGEFALGLAVTAPVIMFANLQLSGVQATDARREYDFGDYLALRLATTMLAMLVIIGTLFFSGYRTATMHVILAIAAAKAFEAVSDIFYGLLQQNERMDCIARSMMVKGLLSLVALGAGIYLTGEVFWGAVGMAASCFLILLFFDVPNGRVILRRNGLEDAVTQGKGALLPKANLRRLLRLFWVALPLGLVMLLISLNSNMPRYFIEHHLGTGQLGIFAALAYLLLAGNTVVSALGQSASPRLARYYSAGDVSAFRFLLLKLVAIGGILGGGGVLVASVAGPELLAFLYTPEFAVRADVFLWLMIAGMITYVSSSLGYGMTAARFFRVQLPLFALVTAVSVAACFVLIPRFGLLGAAWALIAVSFAQFAGSACINARALWIVQKGKCKFHEI